MSEKKRALVANLVRWLGTFLSLGLFLWMVLVYIDWNSVLSYIGGIYWGALVLALGLYLASQAFNTLRWCALLWTHGVKITYWQAFRITWSGIFASNFLPSTIGGDGLRMVAVYPYAKSKTVAVGSVALDRLINMAAMTCLIPFPLALFGGKLWTLVAITLPFNFKALFERYFPKLAGAVREWAARPRAFWWAFLAAWPSNLVFMLAAWIVARQLGMEISYVQVMAVQVVTYFLSVLPISINGLGVREVTYTTLFVWLGASWEQASTLAVLTRFLIMLETLPGALWVSTVAADVAGMEKPE
jgi:hypothetical protein